MDLMSYSSKMQLAMITKGYLLILVAVSVLYHIRFSISVTFIRLIFSKCIEHLIMIGLFILILMASIANIY